MRGCIFEVDDLNNKIIGVQLGTTGDLFASDIEGATLESLESQIEELDETELNETGI